MKWRSHDNGGVGLSNGSLQHSPVQETRRTCAGREVESGVEKGVGKRPGAISNPREYFSAGAKERSRLEAGGPDESSANMSVW